MQSAATIQVLRKNLHFSKTFSIATTNDCYLREMTVMITFRWKIVNIKKNANFLYMLENSIESLRLRHVGGDCLQQFESFLRWHGSDVAGKLIKRDKITKYPKYQMQMKFDWITSDGAAECKQTVKIDEANIALN